MFLVRHAKSTGGKAGKGHNKTSSVQVVEKVDRNYCKVISTYRYVVGDRDSYSRALSRANRHVLGLSS